MLLFLIKNWKCEALNPRGRCWGRSQETFIDQRQEATDERRRWYSFSPSLCCGRSPTVRSFPSHAPATAVILECQPLPLWRLSLIPLGGLRWESSAHSRDPGSGLPNTPDTNKTRCILWANPHDNPAERYCFNPHFTHAETKVFRDPVNWTRLKLLNEDSGYNGDASWFRGKGWVWKRQKHFLLKQNYVSCLPCLHMSDMRRADTLRKIYEMMTEGGTVTHSRHQANGRCQPSQHPCEKLVSSPTYPWGDWGLSKLNGPSR